MVELGEEDVIKGLKRLKSLAKQDFLASTLAPDPDFWLEYASARKEKYEDLIRLVEENGVEGAMDLAMREYKDLVAVAGVAGNEEKSPGYKGTRQALELFFKVLGVDPDAEESQRKHA